MLAHLASLGIEKDEAEKMVRLLDADASETVTPAPINDAITPDDPVLKAIDSAEPVEVSEEVVEDSSAELCSSKSINIPFQENAPSFTSKLYGANARGYVGSSTRGYSTYSSGFSRGFSSPASVTIPFKANTASYGASGTRVASSGYSGYSSGSSRGYSSPSSVTIPFKANTPSFSTAYPRPITSSYSTPATSYASPMKAPAPMALGGSGAAANFYQNYSKDRDLKLRQTIDNAVSLHA